MSVTFDPKALYQALERARRERNTTWRGILVDCDSRAANIGARLRSGCSLDANTLVKLLAWLGETDLKPYIRSAPAAVSVDAGDPANPDTHDATEDDRG